MLCRTIFRTLGVGSSAHASFSTSASQSVVDQLLSYVKAQCKDKPDQAVDVLRSGLTMVPPTGVDAARVHLELANIKADMQDMVSCGEHLDGVASSTKDVSPDSSDSALAVELYTTARRLATMHLLIKGDDTGAINHAEDAVRHVRAVAQAAKDPSTHAALLHPYTSALGTHLSTAHAVAMYDSAAVSAYHLQQLCQGEGIDPVTMEHRLELNKIGSGGALVALGQWRTKVGDAQLAMQCFEHVMSSAGTMQDPEVLADALSSQGQLAMHSQQWDAAEELLGNALSAAEGISSPQHPRLAALLMLLGNVYARTARVTHAEGMYRQASKLLHLDAPNPWTAKHTAHPSLPAALAWKLAQLYHALPNRSSEQGAWSTTAQSLWEQSGYLSRFPIHDVLGSQDFLSGTGTSGSGVIVSVQMRRLLPKT